MICTHRVVSAITVIVIATISVTNQVTVGESDVELPSTTPIISSVENEPTETAVEDVEIAKTTFRVTAYCSCSECCGKWALNRPKDQNGNEIVIGAANVPLTPLVSCASPLPFGTKIDLDGYGTVVVQDRTAQWVVDKYGENIIDIYVNDHADIKKIGRQFVEGVIVE